MLNLHKDRVPRKGMGVVGPDGQVRIVRGTYTNPVKLPILIHSFIVGDDSKTTNGVKVFIDKETQKIDQISVMLPDNPEQSARILYSDNGVVNCIQNKRGHQWIHKIKQHSNIFGLHGFPDSDPIEGHVLIRSHVTRRTRRGGMGFIRDPEPGDDFRAQVWDSCEEYPAAIDYVMKREKEIIELAMKICGIDLLPLLILPVGTSWLSYLPMQNQLDRFQPS